jgi:hypothetical protein
MVSKKEIHRQLKAIGFNYMGWGRSEITELPKIILPDEEIYECVNGIYEGGFALLVATTIRVLLIDKKPLNYLTVEDMRYDMISEMDYSHRLLGAHISISSNGKNLLFKSYNKPRLRKLIGHVQHCISDNKKKQFEHQDSQVAHLEQINKQLQAYLIAQHQYQVDLQESIKKDKALAAKVPDPPKPSYELADYLYAQSLIKQYNETYKANLEASSISPVTQADQAEAQDTDLNQELYQEGVNEVFKHLNNQPQKLPGSVVPGETVLNVNPTNIAFSKLPMALRNRRFGRATNFIKLKTNKATN